MDKKIIIETKRRRAMTLLGQLERLTVARSNWSRRITIATNKYDEVQRRIDKLALQMAEARFQSDLDNSFKAVSNE